jgi:hypothetical protein
MFELGLMRACGEKDQLVLWRASPLVAYRKAQLHMLHEVGAKPALWVGFTMYGNQ